MEADVEQLVDYQCGNLLVVGSIPGVNMLVNMLTMPIFVARCLYSMLAARTYLN